MQRHANKITRPIRSCRFQRTVIETCEAFGQASMAGIRNLSIETISCAEDGFADRIKLGRAALASTSLAEVGAAQRRFATRRFGANLNLVFTLADVLMHVTGESAMPLMQMTRQVLERRQEHEAACLRSAPMGQIRVIM